MGSIISALGGGIGGLGSFMDSKTQETMGNQNRDAYSMAARDALLRGGIESQRAALKAGQTMGQAKVALATSGVDTQSGTALQDIATTASMSALDRLTIENNAAREAWGYKVKANQAWEEGQINSAKDFYNSLSQPFGSMGGAVSDAKSISSFLG